MAFQYESVPLEAYPSDPMTRTPPASYFRSRSNGAPADWAPHTPNNMMLGTEVPSAYPTNIDSPGYENDPRHRHIVPDNEKRNHPWSTVNPIHTTYDSDKHTPYVDGTSSFEQIPTSTLQHGPASHERPNDSTESSLNEVRATLLASKGRKHLTTWLTAILTLASSALTVWYSQRAMVDRTALPPALQHSPGTTVLIANVLSHIVSFLVVTLFMETLESLRWALACRRQGVLLTTFLAMSRATPVAGVLYLCKVRGWHQIWALQR